MAIIRQIENVPVTEEERTWRATIETPKGKPYSVTIHREVRSLDAHAPAHRPRL